MVKRTADAVARACMFSMRSHGTGRLGESKQLGPALELGSDGSEVAGYFQPIQIEALARTLIFKIRRR